MTVIAWDGKTLAADKRSTVDYLQRTVTKIERATCGSLLGACGDAAMCRSLRQWWTDGASAEKWPDKEDKATLMVVTPTGCVLMYDGGPVPIEYSDPFAAIGHGRDYAIAAMHLGKNAVEAVELASLYDTSCGNGVDTLTLNEAMA
jgi:ATP-dependent protease HslVU (ClpYQ) peptidase subunit